MGAGSSILGGVDTSCLGLTKIWVNRPEMRRPSLVLSEISFSFSFSFSSFSFLSSWGANNYEVCLRFKRQKRTLASLAGSSAVSAAGSAGFSLLYIKSEQRIE